MCDLSKIDHYFVPAQTTIFSTPENIHQSDVTLPEDPADTTKNGNGDKMIFKLSTIWENTALLQLLRSEPLGNVLYFSIPLEK